MLDRRDKTFTHRIDGRIDDERDDGRLGVLVLEETPPTGDWRPDR